MLYPEPQIVSRLHRPQLFSGEGHAFFAGTCGSFVSSAKNPRVSTTIRRSPTLQRCRCHMEGSVAQLWFQIRGNAFRISRMEYCSAMGRPCGQLMGQSVAASDRSSHSILFWSRRMLTLMAARHAMDAAI